MRIVKSILLAPLLKSEITRSQESMAALTTARACPALAPKTAAKPSLASPMLTQLMVAGTSRFSSGSQESQFRGRRFLTDPRIGDDKILPKMRCNHIGRLLGQEVNLASTLNRSVRYPWLVKAPSVATRIVFFVGINRR